MIWDRVRGRFESSPFLCGFLFDLLLLFTHLMDSPNHHTILNLNKIQRVSSDIFHN